MYPGRKLVKHIAKPGDKIGEVSKPAPVEEPKVRKEAVKKAEKKVSDLELGSKRVKKRVVE
jgi:hypothetical protein